MSDQYRVVIRARVNAVAILSRTTEGVLGTLAQACCVTIDEQTELYCEDGSLCASSASDKVPAEGETFYLYGNADFDALHLSEQAHEEEAPVRRPQEFELPAELGREARTGPVWERARTELQRFVSNPQFKIWSLARILRL
jgi:hypothetical protein